MERGLTKNAPYRKPYTNRAPCMILFFNKYPVVCPSMCQYVSPTHMLLPIFRFRVYTPTNFHILVLAGQVSKQSVSVKRQTRSV